MTGRRPPIAPAERGARRLLSLDDPDALDVARVGVKAARLAQARRRGVAVLPGLIVPVAESSRAVQAGQAALQEHGLGAARPAVMAAGLDAGLATALGRVKELGSRLVVRSSSSLDDEGAWSGAFASFSDVAPGDVAAAVRGCWASLFAPGAVARFEQMGRSPDAAGLAVLVQRQLMPIAGGWARVTEDAVEVAAIDGPPSRLLGGWERGSHHVVARDGTLRSTDAAGGLEAHTIRQVADMARAAQRELSADRIEWALADGTIVILQLEAGPTDGAGPAPAAPTPIPAALAARPFRRLAALLVGRPGRLADRLIVPWAAAAPDSIDAPRLAGRPAALFAEAKRRALELGEAVATSAGLSIPELLDRLDAADPLLGDRLSGVTVDGSDAGFVLGALESVGEALTARGVLRAPDELWWQTVDWIDAALSSDEPTPAARWLGDRWAHLVYGVAAAHGVARSGTAASDGRAAGRATFVAGPRDVGSLRRRDVLIVDRPLRTLAPLLWQASALVSRSGSPGAHLCEVARSLRVPAVVGADVDRPGGGTVAAVDGSSGEVWLWTANAGRRERVAGPVAGALP